ncbi:MAG: KH domain-containing protein [Phormidesmis sp.]
MSSPDQADTEAKETAKETTHKTDFEALARFLMEPFLDKPEALKFHVETLAGGKKLWLRAAFDEAEDKGRVFGRGGRNIKAIRNVIAAAAKPSDRVVNLSVFGEPAPERSDRGDRGSDRTSSRGDRGGRSGGGRGRGGDRASRPPRPSTNPAPPRKKPKTD